MNEFIKPSEVPNTIKSEAPKNKSLHSEAYNVASDKAVASDNVGQILKDNNRDVLVKEVEANFVNIGRKLNQLPASVQAEVISNFKEYADTQSNRELLQHLIKAMQSGKQEISQAFHKL